MSATIWVVSLKSKMVFKWGFIALRSVCLTTIYLLLIDNCLWLDNKDIIELYTTAKEIECQTQTWREVEREGERNRRRDWQNTLLPKCGGCSVLSKMCISSISSWFSNVINVWDWSSSYNTSKCLSSAVDVTTKFWNKKKIKIPM